MATRTVRRDAEDLPLTPFTQRLSRRDMLKGAAALGLGAPILGGLLAACSDDDDEPSAPSTDDEDEDEDEDVADEDEEDADDEDADEPDASPDTAGGGRIIIAQAGTGPCTLDPHVNSCSNDTIYHHALFDHLIERSPDGTLYPGLADSWEVAEDGVTWTLNLRNDVPITFHDGTPFNADAVVFNFDRIVDPDTRSEYAVFQLGPYDSSRAIDEQTVELTLSRPYGLLPVSLATYGIAMVSPTAVETYGDEFAFNPVGTGPFIFVEEVPQSHVIFRRNPDYNWASPIHAHEGPALVEEVEFRFIPENATRSAALLSGEVDVATIVGADFNTFDESPDYKTQKILTEGYPPAGIFINVTNPPCDDVQVRKALAFGVDRHEVNLIVYEGHSEDADSVMSNFSWAYDPATALYNFDPDQAAELLDEAGWTMGSDGIREKDGEPLHIVHLALTSVRPVAEVVQAQLANIGVDVELLVQDNPAQQQTAQQGLHHLVWTQWSGVDPGDLWKIYRCSEIGSGWNFTHYCDDRVEELFDMGEAENDEATRREIYGELSMILMEQATFIPLNNRTVFLGMKAEVMGTEVIDERGSWGRLYNFYIDENA